MEDKLTTVHDCVAEAQQAPKESKRPMGTHTFRIHDDIKSRARELCEAHGTTLDEYLRKCCELLPQDYLTKNT